MLPWSNVYVWILNILNLLQDGFKSILYTLNNRLVCCHAKSVSQVLEPGCSSASLTHFPSNFAFQLCFAAVHIFFPLIICPKYSSFLSLNVLIISEMHDVYRWWCIPRIETSRVKKLKRVLVLVLENANYHNTLYLHNLNNDAIFTTYYIIQNNYSIHKNLRL